LGYTHHQWPKDRAARRHISPAGGALKIEDRREADGAMAVLVSSGESVPSVDAADPFERLFLAEYTRVVAIANRVLADGHEAEDVAQEVFASFHRRHAPDAPYAGAWLHAAAVHAALNVVRGRQRRARREAAQAGSSDRLRGHAERKLDPQCAVEAGE